ncbi:hypothetical protein OIU79_003612 [Salix purpurea]|uniref:Uncharacterized protein n=1 Tax=Salix purpurea TaxID=77065 RepID=A0A9Q0UMK6_SALPP|nr:hypothetical protein OIU79_003612 [Salix purpurea]
MGMQGFFFHVACPFLYVFRVNGMCKGIRIFLSCFYLRKLLQSYDDSLSPCAHNLVSH